VHDSRIRRDKALKLYERMYRRLLSTAFAAFVSAVDTRKEVQVRLQAVHRSVQLQHAREAWDVWRRWVATEKDHRYIFARAVRRMQNLRLAQVPTATCQPVLVPACTSACTLVTFECKWSSKSCCSGVQHLDERGKGGADIAPQDAEGGCVFPLHGNLCCLPAVAERGGVNEAPAATSGASLQTSLPPNMPASHASMGCTGSRYPQAPQQPACTCCCTATAAKGPCSSVLLLAGQCT
jgi:hypothetical protein